MPRLFDGFAAGLKGLNESHSKVTTKITTAAMHGHSGAKAAALTISMRNAVVVIIIVGGGGGGGGGGLKKPNMSDADV